MNLLESNKSVTIQDREEGNMLGVSSELSVAIKYITECDYHLAEKEEISKYPDYFLLISSRFSLPTPLYLIKAVSLLRKTSEIENAVCT